MPTPFLALASAALLSAAAPAAAQSSAARAPVPPPAPSAGTESQSLGYLTAAQLARRCKDSAPGSITYCFAYVTGVHDTIRAYGIWLGQREFCPPEKTSQSELRQTFLAYLTAYPSNESGQAASVVSLALRETYPCLDAPARPPESGTPATAPKKRR